VDNQTIALNILDIEKSIEQKQTELEALHEMKEQLIRELAQINPDLCV